MEQQQNAVKVRFSEITGNSPAGKLASAELLFTSGVLEGLRLVGFTVWKKSSGRNVTVPSRQYFVNGQRRTFALLRLTSDDSGPQNSLRDWILSEFAAYESERTARTADDEFPDLPRP